MITRSSSRRRPSPSSEEELMDEEGDDGEQQEESTAYKGPSMNKAPYTVCFEAQFTSPFTNYQFMTLAWQIIHFL
jgi:hypothetical protein